jgi:hypothetical protein
MNQRRKITATNGAIHDQARGLKAGRKIVGHGAPSSSTFVPRTELGLRLLRIRRKILASGQPLLDWNDIEGELRERRGEATEEPRD